MTDIVERLRSNATLNVCPFDKLSPEYYKTPSDNPCKFCGGEPEWPNKCTGADLRVMKEAADTIERLRAELAALREQEPVAWACKCDFDNADGRLTVCVDRLDDILDSETVPLYAAPVPAVTVNPDAIAALTNNQRQLDADGCEVGVSRQALDELLAAVGGRS